MKEVPEKILTTFEHVKKKYPFRVVLKIIRGKYYIYKDKGVWLKDEAKTKIISEYLGRITGEGLYLKKAFSTDNDLENAKTIIESMGGEIIWHEKAEQKRFNFPSNLKEIEVNDTYRNILTLLSMGIKPSSISRQLGITQPTLYNRLKKLESEYNIHHTVEIDINKLGFLDYMVFIKFGKNRPSLAAIKETIEKEPTIQLAMFAEGVYDIVFYLTIRNDENLRKEFFELRSRIFPSYDFKLYATPVYFDYGFIPLRDKFFDLLKNNIWHRTKERRRPTSGDIMKREFAVLKELNKNSDIKLTEIDKKYGLSKGSARYALNELKTKGVIKGLTISIRNVPIRYNSIIILKKLNHEAFSRSRKDLLLDIIEETGYLINKYAFVSDIKIPEGVMLLLPVYSNEQLELEEDRLNSINGVILKRLIVVDVLVGSLCYRHFDNTNSSQYNILENQYGIKVTQLQSSFSKD